MKVDEIEVKTIPGFLNYAVSKNGKVWSKSRRDRLNHRLGGWRLPHLSHGYLRLKMCNEGESRMVFVHRLVLETFVGPCPPGMEVCHNNGNRQDNRLENLRWDTKSNNHQDAIRHGTHTSLHQNGELNPVSKLKEEDIKVIFHAYHDGTHTQQELADYFGVARGTIQPILERRTWKHVWNT